MDTNKITRELAQSQSRELWRREADGRVLVAHQHHDGEQPWIIIANEDDWSAQSIVLTIQEYRWLYWEALGGKYNQEWWAGREGASAILMKVAEQPHAFIEKEGKREGEHGWDGDPDSCAVCWKTRGNPIHVIKVEPSEICKDCGMNWHVCLCSHDD